jgi:hypothetical protein
MIFFQRNFNVKITGSHGVDIMITIFCDFRELSSKNSRILSKKRHLIHIFFFAKKYIGPGVLTRASFVPEAMNFDPSCNMATR